MADRLDALYDGLCQTREAYSSELSTKVAALGLERCCLYPGEMLKAAEGLRAGDSAKEIQAKIESGEFECPDLFYASLPKTPSRETCEMSNQEFIAHINTLIPAPSKEINGNLLDFGNILWFELKEDLYNAFSFISRHFTPETLQSVYDLSGATDQGMLPWEMMGAAIYLQAGTPLREIKIDEWESFIILPTPETPDAISSLAACTVREYGCETRLYTLHFGQFSPQELLKQAAARVRITGGTITEAIQNIDYNMQPGHTAANKALCGPESPMAEKLALLMDMSPVTAAHITIDADSGSVTVKINPLWEKLRAERGISPPARQTASRRSRFFKQKNQPDR